MKTLRSWANACAAGIIAFSGVMLNVNFAHSWCEENMVYTTIDNFPNYLTSAEVDLLFDGSTAYSGNQNLRFQNPKSPGRNALIGNLNQSFLAGATLTFHFEIDDADGLNADFAVKVLTNARLDAWYWDRNRNRVLDPDDFDVNGDNVINIGKGDYSPLGFVISFYNGDPGDPVGSGPGTLVDTQYTPIMPIAKVSYSFVAVAPAEFSHFSIESTPVDLGVHPRLVEIEVNGMKNGRDAVTIMRPQCAMECDCS